MKNLRTLSAFVILVWKEAGHPSALKRVKDMIAQRSFYSNGQEIWQFAALEAPELWTPPSDNRECGHVWVKEEHVATLNDQTQAWTSAKLE